VKVNDWEVVELEVRGAEEICGNRSFQTVKKEEKLPRKDMVYPY